MPTAKRIREVRLELGMTQDQLASALSISVWTLRGWEQERVEGSKTREAPAYLELALRYLLDAREDLIHLQKELTSGSGSATKKKGAKKP